MLLLLVLAVLYPGGDNQGASQEPTSFHLIQISSFVNSTWIQYHGSGWLDDLQIHGWNSVADTAIFLKPWSKGNFSDVEISDLVELFRVYTFAFIREMRAHVHAFHLEYPFEIQGIAGCELQPGGAILSFLRGALGGLDFVLSGNLSTLVMSSLPFGISTRSPEASDVSPADNLMTLHPVIMDFDQIIVLVVSNNNHNEK
ncbi:T-cell surface glycoprotein CD1b-like [Ictidomys tridecemlineatus]|nr:T-cell surface glycoprotein CD1b-like [Ictidomys tridecemlineatus]